MISSPGPLRLYGRFDNLFITVLSALDTTGTLALLGEGKRTFGKGIEVGRIQELLKGVKEGELTL